MDEHARLLRDAQRVLLRYGVESGGDLRSLRGVLEQHLFDGDELCRDDVAEIAMKIDEWLGGRESDRDVGGGGISAWEIEEDVSGGGAAAA